MARLFTEVDKFYHTRTKGFVCVRLKRALKHTAGLLFGGRSLPARARDRRPDTTTKSGKLKSELFFSRERERKTTHTERSFWVRGGEQTLQQACSQEYPGSARCVQSFDDSLDSAIRITYRISLRSSSMWEPRHPSLKVVLNFRLSAAQALPQTHTLLSIKKGAYYIQGKTTLNTRL